MCDPWTLAMGAVSLIGNRPQSAPAIETEVDVGGELEAARENTGAEVALGGQRDEDIMIDPLDRKRANERTTSGTGLNVGSATGVNIL